MSLASFPFQFAVVYWQSWESPQILVEGLATTVVGIQFLQFILYHARLGAKHWCFGWGAWAAYYVPVPLAALAVTGAAVMLRFPCPSWLVAIFFAAGQADTMSAYSLRDAAHKQSLRRFAKRVLSLAYLALVLLHGATISSLRRMEIFSLVLGTLVMLQDLKICGRAMIPPEEICKIAADHVRFQARGQRWGSASALGEFDDDQPQDRESVVAVGSLESYSYRSAVSGCTTLADLRITFHDYCSRMEDACLSSALFLELLKRYGYGYCDRPQVLDRSSAHRAFRDVIAGDRWRWDRALRIVEVQLNFMRDYFFGAHGSPSSTSYRLYMVQFLLKIIFLLSVLSLIMAEEEEKPRRANLYALILLQVCQLVGYLRSDHFLVSYKCDQQQDISRSEVSAAVSNEIHLGRYILIEDFDRPHLLQRLVRRLLGRQRPQRGNLTPREKMVSSIRCNDFSCKFHQLKTWICGKAVGPETSEPPRFSFDEQSIMRGSNSTVDHLVSWTLDKETKIHTILLWHIATWFCDMSTTQDVKLAMIEWISPAEYTFATMLSSYCAYLVASRPELLHEHPALTRSIHDEVVKQAKFLFGGGTLSAEERYAVVKNSRLELVIDYPRHNRGLLREGIELGQKLMNLSGSERWKIMADFWAEMTLFVARSGNPAAHIEHLAQGDEFITQLWALQSNAWDRTPIRWNDSDGSWSWDAFHQDAHQMIGRLADAFEACDFFSDM